LLAAPGHSSIASAALRRAPASEAQGREPNDKTTCAAGESPPRLRSAERPQRTTTTIIWSNVRTILRCVLNCRAPFGTAPRRAVLRSRRAMPAFFCGATQANRQVCPTVHGAGASVRLELLMKIPQRSALARGR